MKSVATGTASGCGMWVLAFAVISLCLCPMTMMFGGLSSTLQADWVAGIVGPYLCPENSTAEIITFQTTSIDDFGNETPATGYEMQCVDVEGVIVRAPNPDYAFIWIGVLGGGAFILSGLLGLVLAAPVGGLMARYSHRKRNRSPNV